MDDTAASDPHLLTSIEALEAIYGDALPQAITKEIDYISDDYRAFVEHSPFALIASVGPEGIDCSPRGDPAGFVEVVDQHTVLIPDRRGNNRIDTLRNIVRDPRVALLFLVPGVGETLRINGRAEISVEPELLEQFSMQGKLPRSVIRVTAERVYFQCSKALVRSKLWKPESQVERSALPSTGKILERLAKDDFDGDAYDAHYPERIKQTMY